MNRGCWNHATSQILGASRSVTAIRCRILLVQCSSNVIKHTGILLVDFSFFYASSFFACSLPVDDLLHN